MAVSHSVVNWNDLAIDAGVPTYIAKKTSNMHRTEILK